jgi:mannonate dehydratase
MDDDPGLRVGHGQQWFPDREYFQGLTQLGIRDVVYNLHSYDATDPQWSDHPISGENEFDYEGLRELRSITEDAGCRIHAIENVPRSFYIDAMLGGPKQDEQIEHVKNTIRNVGRAGIPKFGYHFKPVEVYATGQQPVRGGAMARTFDREEIPPEELPEGSYTESELWSNYEHFLEEVLPVAEEAGVTMCLHPNDPPVETVGEVPQLFRNFEAFERAMTHVDSDHHELQLCLGTWSQMGEDLERAIRHFGGRDEIGYVHFRDVIGTVPSFVETYLDDPESNYDAVRMMQLLSEVGYDGVVIPDHVPTVDAAELDGRSFTFGYLKGIQDAIERLV